MNSIVKEKNDFAVTHNYAKRYAKSTRHYVAVFDVANFTGYFSILCNVVGKGNFICSPKSNFSKPMTDEDIMELLKVKESTYNRFIAECRKNTYLSRVISGKDKFFVINPAYRMYDRDLNITLYQHFCNDITFLKSLSRKTKDELSEYGIDVESEIIRLYNKGERVNDFEKYMEVNND